MRSHLGDKANRAAKGPLHFRGCRPQPAYKHLPRKSRKEFRNAMAGNTRRWAQPIVQKFRKFLVFKITVTEWLIADDEARCMVSPGVQFPHSDMPLLMKCFVFFA